MYGGDSYFDTQNFVSAMECAAICHAESSCFSASHKFGTCYLYRQGAAVETFDTDSTYIVSTCSYGK